MKVLTWLDQGPLHQALLATVLVKKVPGAAQASANHKEHEQRNQEASPESDVSHFPRLGDVDKVLRVDISGDHDVGTWPPESRVGHCHENCHDALHVTIVSRELPPSRVHSSSGDSRLRAPVTGFPAAVAGTTHRAADSPDITHITWHIWERYPQ